MMLVVELWYYVECGWESEGWSCWDNICEFDLEDMFV